MDEPKKGCAGIHFAAMPPWPLVQERYRWTRDISKENWKKKQVANTWHNLLRYTHTPHSCIPIKRGWLSQWRLDDNVVRRCEEGPLTQPMKSNHGFSPFLSITPFAELWCQHSRHSDRKQSTRMYTAYTSRLCIFLTYVFSSYSNNYFKVKKIFFPFRRWSEARLDCINLTSSARLDMHSSKRSTLYYQIRIINILTFFGRLVFYMHDAIQDAMMLRFDGL